MTVELYSVVSLLFICYHRISK